MKTLKDEGGFNLLIVPLVLMTLLFIGAAVMAVSINTKEQDYKNNSDKKVAAAVDVAKKEVATAKDTEFVEKEKQPLRTYQSPSTSGSVVITYPKTWSAFVTENSAQGGTPIDGYFHPSFVPGLQSGTAFALRVQVLAQAYDQVMQPWASKMKIGKVKIAGYRATKVPSVLGSRVDGEVDTNKQGSVVILPMRDKTLVVTTQAPTFVNDFNNNVLPNLNFTP